MGLHVICDTDTRFCCKNCGTDLFEDKKCLCSFSRKHFMNEVLSSDVICMRYTGVPIRSMIVYVYLFENEDIVQK
jgi:hypothetical protein